MLGSWFWYSPKEGWVGSLESTWVTFFLAHVKSHRPQHLKT